ncbi:class I SAM-dependent methyltransferase [Synechococcus sp. CCY 9618]|uniref:class I SAM-dependent methyltransferase n=1 Tax=Synechococcus sp. CCY 9618 TaxID=2815602 RepID=UPI001C231DE7
MLDLHERHQTFSRFEDFHTILPALLQQGQRLDACVRMISTLGILEPLTGEHIPPEHILVNGPNYRESLIAHGLLSRNRAILQVMECQHGSLEAIRRKQIFLPETLTGLAFWLKHHIASDCLVQSEFHDDDLGSTGSDMAHQDLCHLTFNDSHFDLVICSELFEHVYSLDRALREIRRVLKPDGRLVATFPMAFGQSTSIEKARWNETTGNVELLGEADFHGDPFRPEQGSLVFRIPGWEILDQCRAAGLSDCRIHLISSWKLGVLGGDLPGVLVLEAQR